MSEREPALIGVVTVTYNSGKVLSDFLESIAKQEFRNFRLYAVDNASQDGSADILERAALSDARIVTIRSPDNLGVAEGNNIGIRRSIEDGCTHILLLNNDTVFEAGLFGTLLQSAEAQNVAVVVPKMYFYQPPTMLWFAGGRFRKSRGHVGIHIGEGAMDTGQFDAPSIIEYAPTCCMLVRRDVFTSVGLMDAQFFAYYDDTDFCLRLLRAGVPIRYEPSTTLHHKVSSLMGGNTSPFAVRLGVRNKIYYLRKNFSKPRAVFFAASYFLYMIAQRVLGRDPPELFRVRMSAFREGWRMQPALTSYA